MFDSFILIVVIYKHLVKILAQRCTFNYSFDDKISKGKIPEITLFLNIPWQ